MPQPDPFASINARRWYENVLDIAIPAVAALLTVMVFLLVLR
jgi:hypothetical protein